MLEGKSVAVVVPAYDEEKLIATTLSGIPEFVDRIYVVDDASRDGTAEAARSAGGRVELIEHEKNQGVGAAILTGYKRALADGMDVTASWRATTRWIRPTWEAIATPVVRGEVDYAKANRLFTGRAWELIPRTRYLGNAVLSLLTKIASGYWHVADSQSGYTAINRDTLDFLDLDRIYKRYGFPNDMLVHLNVINARVRDVPSRPVYGVGESSGIRLRKVVPRDFVAPDQGVLLADAREVRDPRLPSARLLLRLRDLLFADRARAWSHGHGAPVPWQRVDGRHRRPGRAPPDDGLLFTLFAMLLRHGVEQRPEVRRRTVRRRAGASGRPHRAEDVLDGHDRRADDARRSPSRHGTIRRSRVASGSERLKIPSRTPASSWRAPRRCRRRSTITAGLKKLTVPASTSPSVRPASRTIRIARHGPGTRRTTSRLWVASSPLGQPLRERLAAGDRLEAADVAAAADDVLAARDPDVADVAGGAPGAAVDVAVGDDPAADPGADLDRAAGARSRASGSSARRGP